MTNGTEQKGNFNSTEGKITANANSVLLVLVGFLFGIIVGYAFTNNANNIKSSKETSTEVSKDKDTIKSNKEVSKKSEESIPIKDGEALPPNHPNVKDLEGQVKSTLEFGKKNQDYDSQLQVGAYLYTQVNMPEEAKPFLLKANELKPDELEPIILLGALCFDTARQKNDMKLMGEATKWYEKSLKIKPDDLDILTDMGIAYQYVSPPNHKKALECFDKTLSKNPKHLPALYNKTRSYISLKDLQAAEKTLELFKQSATDPTNKSVQELAKSLEEEIKKIKTK